MSTHKNLAPSPKFQILYPRLIHHRNYSCDIPNRYTDIDLFYSTNLVIELHCPMSYLLLFLQLTIIFILNIIRKLISARLVKSHNNFLQNLSSVTIILY